MDRQKLACTFYLGELKTVFVKAERSLRDRTSSTDCLWKAMISALMSSWEINAKRGDEHISRKRKLNDYIFTTVHRKFIAENIEHKKLDHISEEFKIKTV